MPPPYISWPPPPLYQATMSQRECCRRIRRLPVWDVKWRIDPSVRPWPSLCHHLDTTPIVTWGSGTETLPKGTIEHWLCAIAYKINGILPENLCIDSTFSIFESCFAPSVTVVGISLKFPIPEKCCWAVWKLKFEEFHGVNFKFTTTVQYYLSAKAPGPLVIQ